MMLVAGSLGRWVAGSLFCVLITATLNILDGLHHDLASSPLLARVSPHMGFGSVLNSPVFQHR